MSRSRSPSPRRRSPSPRRESHGDSEGSTNLFIGNLSYNTRERDLEDIFSKYGKVQDVRITEDIHTGRSKGFAFVTMEDARDAADAARQANGMSIEGRDMRVEISHGRRNGVSSTACRDFRRGNCSYGDKCRFSHDENAVVRESNFRDRRDDRRDDRGYGRDRRDDRRDDRGYGRDRRDDRRDDRGYGRDDRYDDRRDRRRSPSPRRDRDRSRDRY